MSFLTVARTEFLCRLRSEPVHVVLLGVMFLSTAAAMIGLWLTTTIIPRPSPSFGSSAYFGLEPGGVLIGVAGNRAGALFYALSALLLCATMAVAPIAASATLNRERDGEAIEGLMLTGISSFRIILGKLVASFARTVLIIAGAVPALAVCWLFGGVSLQLVTLTAVLILTSALVGASIALFTSSLTGASTTALLATYLILSVFALAGPIALVIAVVTAGGPEWLPLLYPTPAFALLSLQPELVAALRSLIPLDYRDAAIQLVQPYQGSVLPYPFLIISLAGYAVVSVTSLVLSSIFLDPYHPLRNVAASWPQAVWQRVARTRWPSR